MNKETTDMTKREAEPSTYYAWFGDLLLAYRELNESHLADLEDAKRAATCGDNGKAKRIRAEVRHDSAKCERKMLKASRELIDHCNEAGIACEILECFAEYLNEGKCKESDELIKGLLPWLDELDYESSKIKAKKQSNDSIVKPDRDKPNIPLPLQYDSLLDLEMDAWIYETKVVNKKTWPELIDQLAKVGPDKGWPPTSSEPQLRKRLKQYYHAELKKEYEPGVPGNPENKRKSELKRGSAGNPQA